MASLTSNVGHSGLQKGSTSQIINHLKNKHHQFGPVREQKNPECAESAATTAKPQKSVTLAAKSGKNEASNSTIELTTGDQTNLNNQSNSKTAYAVNAKPPRANPKPRRPSMSASCVSPATPDSGYFSSDLTDNIALDEGHQVLEDMDLCSNDELLSTSDPLEPLDPQFQDRHVLAAVSLATKPAPANSDVEGPQNTKQLPASALDYNSYLYLKSQDAPAGSERWGVAEAASANWHRMRNAERTRAMREGRKDRINDFKEVMIREAKRKQQQRGQVAKQLKPREAAYKWETNGIYSDSGTESGEEEEEAEAEAEFQLLAGYELPQCQCKGGEWCWWCP